MYNREAVRLVTLLDGRRLDYIACLLNYVQLNKPIVPSVFVGDLVELSLVQTIHITYVPQPRVEQTKVLGGHGSLDAAAAVMATHDDVLDFEVAHGVVNDGHDVEVGGADEIGNVAVDEHVTSVEAGNGFGGDARIGAAYVPSVSLEPRGRQEACDAIDSPIHRYSGL